MTLVSGLGTRLRSYFNRRQRTSVRNLCIYLATMANQRIAKTYAVTLLHAATGLAFFLVSKSKSFNRCYTVPMATPNFFPSYTVRSANTSPVVVRRRPKVPPKGSLPVFSRPGVYKPTPKRAVPTTYPVKGNSRGKGAEGVISRRHGVDDETQRILKESEAICRRSDEGAQGLRDFWRDFGEDANQLQQKMKDAMENAAKEDKEFQERVTRGVDKCDQIIKELAEMYEESDRKAIEYRRLSKAQDQQLHEAQVEYREARRANRRAGLR
ncbi:hypothetical protein DENSPDRAFT_691231 [Dentipellis sp. KUC8613]|nr:hypothetical protein DENSPDRAFT_691231 [Dentipellis sp. KUC8613]